QRQFQAWIIRFEQIAKLLSSGERRFAENVERVVIETPECRQRSDGVVEVVRQPDVIAGKSLRCLIFEQRLIVILGVSSGVVIVRRNQYAVGDRKSTRLNS